MSNVQIWMLHIHPPPSQHRRALQSAQFQDRHPSLVSPIQYLNKYFLFCSWVKTLSNGQRNFFFFFRTLSCHSDADLWFRNKMSSLHHYMLIENFVIICAWILELWPKDLFREFTVPLTFDHQILISSLFEWSGCLCQGILEILHLREWYVQLHRRIDGEPKNMLPPATAIGTEALKYIDQRHKDMIVSSQSDLIVILTYSKFSLINALQ